VRLGEEIRLGRLHENAGFNVKVQRNVGLEFVAQQQGSLQKHQPVDSRASATTQLMTTALVSLLRTFAVAGRGLSL